MTDREQTSRSAYLRELIPAIVIMGWITVVLAVDVHVHQFGQLVLGILTWALLVFVLKRETVLVRIQVGIVVVFATLIEYSFSPVLDVYTYRLGGIFGVPSFVPPGHGLIYFAALTLGTSQTFQRFGRELIIACIALGGLYAAWGLWLSPQRDALGCFWYGCLVMFLICGRQRLVYVGAFVVVTYLELVGTHWGVWRWSTIDPTGQISIGNPPSGAAGGYGWFDLVAITLAPRMANWLALRAKDGQDLSVQ